MVKILVVCAMGISTSIFVEKVKKSFLKNQIDIKISAAPEIEVEDYINQTDYIFIAPQVAYAEEEVKELCKKYKKQMFLIPFDVYGSTDEKKIYDFIIKSLQIKNGGKNE